MESSKLESTLRILVRRAYHNRHWSRSPVSPAEASLPHDQAQSPLFNRLPTELRLEIFRYALGGTVMHVVLTAARLGSVRCAPNDTQGSSEDDARERWEYRRCIGCRSVFGTWAKDWVRPKTKAIPPRRRRLSALLKTCRRMYVVISSVSRIHSATRDGSNEATPILYTENTFDFRHPCDLVALQRAVPPPRFAAIRSLALFWSPVRTNDNDRIGPRVYRHMDDITSWARACAALAAMPALRELRVYLDWTQVGDPAFMLPTEVFRPLQGVRVAGGFAVLLCSTWDSPWGNAWDSSEYDPDIQELTGGGAREQWPFQLGQKARQALWSTPENAS